MKTAEEFYKEYYPPKMHLFRDKHDRELQVFGINDMVDFAEQYAKALLEEAAEKKWIEADKEKPNYNIPVIVFGINNYGKGRTMRAVWIPKFTEEADNYFGEADYSEEKDEYYWPEGWYERNEHEETNWFIDCKITHWQPLPTAPILSLIPKEQ